MAAGLVLFRGKRGIYFPLPSHIYFVFSNQKFFKEFFSSLSLLKSFIILFYASKTFLLC